MARVAKYLLFTSFAGLTSCVAWLCIAALLGHDQWAGSLLGAPIAILLGLAGISGVLYNHATDPSFNASASVSAANRWNIFSGKITREKSPRKYWLIFLPFFLGFGGILAIGLYSLARAVAY